MQKITWCRQASFTDYHNRAFDSWPELVSNIRPLKGSCLDEGKHASQKAKTSLADLFSAATFMQWTWRQIMIHWSCNLFVSMSFYLQNPKVLRGKPVLISKVNLKDVDSGWPDACLETENELQPDVAVILPAQQGRFRLVQGKLYGANCAFNSGPLLEAFPAIVTRWRKNLHRQRRTFAETWIVSWGLLNARRFEMRVSQNSSETQLKDVKTLSVWTSRKIGCDENLRNSKTNVNA